MNTIPSELVAFPARADRSAYIARRFAPYWGRSLLDVGCDRAVLKTLLPTIAYTGIDIGGTPDLTINLEKIERLPFGDDAFDNVVCSDVLEHIDNLHHTFDELVRVCRRHLIISLPNNWANARQPIARGLGTFSFYGLPVDPPPDRHKWFFNLSEAAHFLQERAKRRSLKVRECFANEKPRALVSRAARHLLYPASERYLNRYAHTVWVVLEKNPS